MHFATALEVRGHVQAALAANLFGGSALVVLTPGNTKPTERFVRHDRDA